MTTQEIKDNIAKQRETNIALYKSITMASHDDPLNKKAEPILQQWREGSKK
ncbi:MAG TPA: hypothetical protein GX523_09105, partial [Desulfitobacterium dehalogenans]|nr:hypothetical protein [Desulfitobacterium dehalogenans]